MKHVNSPDRTDLSLSKLQQPQIKTRLSQTFFTSCNRSMVHGKEATIRCPTGHGTMFLPWVMPVAQLWHLPLATVLRVFHFPRLWKGTCLLQQTVPVASNGKTGRNLSRLGKRTKYLSCLSLRNKDSALYAPPETLVHLRGTRSYSSFV